MERLVSYQWDGLVAAGSGVQADGADNAVAGGKEWKSWRRLADWW